MRKADIAILAVLVLSFAVLVTAHLCIVVGLARRAHGWRAAIAVLVAPLAPYWAIRDRMYVRGVAWLVGAVAYWVARSLAT